MIILYRQFVNDADNYNVRQGTYIQIPTWTKLAFYGPLESWLWDSPQTTEDESYNQFERDLNYKVQQITLQAGFFIEMMHDRIIGARLLVQLDNYFENLTKTTMLTCEMFFSGLRWWFKNVTRLSSLLLLLVHFKKTSHLIWTRDWSMSIYSCYLKRSISLIFKVTHTTNQYWNVDHDTSYMSNAAA